MPVIRIRQIRRLPTGTGITDAKQLSGSGDDPAVRTDTFTAGILFQTEWCTESFGGNL